MNETTLNFFTLEKRWLVSETGSQNVAQKQMNYCQYEYEEIEQEYTISLLSVFLVISPHKNIVLIIQITYICFLL